MAVARGEGPVERRGTLVFTPGGTTAQMRDPQLDADQWAVLTTPEPIREGYTDQGIDTALVLTDHYVYMYDPSLDPRDRWVGVRAPNNEIVDFAQLANRVPRGLESRGADPNDPAFRIYGGFRTAHYVFLYDPTLDPRQRWVRIDTPRPTLSLVMTGQAAVITTDGQVLFYDPQLPVGSRVSGFDLAPGESGTVDVTIDARSGTLVTVTTDRQVVLYDASLDPRSRILGTTLGPNETVDTTMSRVAGNSGVVVTDQRVIVFDGALDPRSRTLTMPLGPNETVTMVDVSGQLAVFVTDGNRAVFYDRTLDPSNRFATADLGGVPQEVRVNQGGNAVAVLTDRGLTVYDGTLDPASRVLQAPLQPGETAVTIQRAGNSFVMVTSGRAVIFDPSRDPRDAFVDVRLPPGEFVAAGGVASGAAVATSGGVVVYDPGADTWYSQEFRDGVTGVFVAQNVVLVTTSTGAVVYDGSRDPRDRWLPVPLGEVAGALAGRDTAMVFNGEQVAFWDTRDGSWSILPPPANETWRNGLINYRIGIVCSEFGAAVWDPSLDPRNAWQRLNPGGLRRVSAIMRDGNSFAVIAEDSVFVYNRSRHEWVEREGGLGATTRGGRGEPVSCEEGEPPETGEVEEPEEPEVVDESTEPEPPGPIATPDPAATAAPDGDGGDGEPGTSVIIIIDASGSMADNGKIDQAKTAARNMLTSGLPVGHEVGLVVFYDCGAIEWTPFTMNYASLLPVIDGIAPSGSTPIAASIGVAADRMRTEGRGSEGRIILLTDGGENCAGDPVEAAESAHQVEVGSGRPGGALPAAGPAYVSADPLLPRSGGLLPAAPATQGGNVRLDVIGFQLDETVTKSMQEVAQAGGGIYLPAQDVGELDKAFQEIARTVKAVEADALKNWLAFGGGTAGFVVLAVFFLLVSRRISPVAAPAAAAYPSPAPPAGPPMAEPFPPVAEPPPPAEPGAVPGEAAPGETAFAPPTGAPGWPPVEEAVAPPETPAGAVSPEGEAPRPVEEERAAPAAGVTPEPAAAAPPEAVVPPAVEEAPAAVPAPEPAPPAAPPTPAPPSGGSAVLLALGGRTASLSVPLVQRAANIGSDPRGDIAFDEPDVALLHAQVRREGDAYVLYAIGEAVVLRNGESVRRAVLVDGDTLALGSARLVFRQATGGSGQ